MCYWVAISRMLFSVVLQRLGEHVGKSFKIHKNNESFLP